MDNTIYNKLIELDKKTAEIFSSFYSTNTDLNALKYLYEKYDDLFNPVIYNKLIDNVRKRFYAGIYLLRWRFLNKYFYYDDKVNDKMKELEVLYNLGFKNFIDYYEYVIGTSIDEILEKSISNQLSNSARSKKILSVKESGKILEWFQNKFSIKINAVYDDEIIKPFCLAEKIPDRVKIYLPAKSKSIQLDKLLHEIGHAVHFSLFSEELNYEDKVFGDYGIAEGFALLFESLNDNNILTENIKVDLKTSGFLKSEQDFKNEYLEILINTVNFYKNDNYSVSEIDHELNSAMYLKGYYFKFNVVNTLGKDWIYDHKAIYILKELMSYGYKFNYLELIKTLKSKWQ